MFAFLPLLVMLLLCLGAVAYFMYAPKLPRPASFDDVKRCSLQVGERSRDYLILQPPGSQGPRPVLIVLHGAGQDAQAMRNATGYAFERLARERGFIVVYPQGYHKHWNDARKTGHFAARTENIDDEQFIGQLIDSLSGEQLIDDKRVFLFGYSNGAQMAFRMALNASERLAGIAAVAACLPTEENALVGARGRAIPVMLVNGTIDPVNPYGGGEVSLFGFGNRGTVRSSEETAQFFAARSGAMERPAVTLESIYDNDPSKATLRSWHLEGKAMVELYSIEGGGHVIPQPHGRMPRLLGLKTSALDSTRRACDFFGL